MESSGGHDLSRICTQISEVAKTEAMCNCLLMKIHSFVTKLFSKIETSWNALSFFFETSILLSTGYRRSMASVACSNQTNGVNA